MLTAGQNVLLFLRYESNSVISMCLGNLEMFNLQPQEWTTTKLLYYYTSNSDLQAPNRFQESYNAKYFKVIKRLKSLQKAETYLEIK